MPTLLILNIEEQYERKHSEVKVLIAQWKNTKKQEVKVLHYLSKTLNYNQLMH